MDRQRARNVRALDVIPRNTDHSLARRRKSRKRVREEIQVIGTAAGTLVDDHGGDALAAVVDSNAAATVGGVGPVGAGEGCTVEAAREVEGAETAGSAVNVAAVVCRLAGEGAPDNCPFVNGHGRDDGCESAGEEGRECKEGEHFNRPAAGVDKRKTGVRWEGLEGLWA